MMTWETVNARLEELEHGQEDHHARIAAMEAKPSTTGPPINEAGITAAFAAIFARLDELEDAAQALRFANHERLESARIAAPTAPESAETASEVPQEPGNATDAVEAAKAIRDQVFYAYRSAGNLEAALNRMHCHEAEVAAALRMYRKVQRLQACDDIFGFGVKMDTFLHFQYAAPLLAWLKEGEAQ